MEQQADPRSAVGGIAPLGEDIFAIDTFMAGCPGITSSYLIRSERPCVIEVGTAGSAETLRDGIASLGVQPTDLATVVLTHIHLDHAGGTGAIAGMFPNAEIVVHERGARHLADPERLMRSARMVWGDRLDVLFGDMHPTAAERIRSVGESGEVDLGGGRRLVSHYAPGHAKHHMALVDSLTGDLYVGDALGVYNPHTGDVRPATPPPDFDLDAALASLRLFTGIDPQRLMFSHFGAVTDVAETIDRAERELRVWVETVREAHGTDGDLDHAIAMVRDQVTSRYTPAPADAAESQAVMDVLSGVEGNVSGIVHWLDRLAADQPGRPHNP
ncbi:glyoxylase-like metal-dependent hydrolase (beta-lactamase superfamily II) [Murinocardiopsis flavida]|uniref:Glyoxylase-like metal-dependent hydrolase (Beta-lactamase superfamily II) n=1 Tax=Murinocardiopsis flavida TaxID=645275 RepID=A0A2P8D3G8_9ACTN|nr:MBL fold metallo-hydrolase [Murinocardiopsis flavida]PSK91736.1 glyoxylase-like metal-dependent hydrolase (beta-lactamase superfamily II) [Murinocardiopsis flavida]